jgi:serine/threonine protein kinase
MIPRCYGAVGVSPPDTPHREVAETLVYGIIIGNIDAALLPSVDLSSHYFSSLGHSLMAAVYSLSLHGVIHNDMRSGNILISPNRIVLIDFGPAILRGDIEDHEHWAKKVELEEEVEALRRILHHHEIRNCTPYIPAKLFRGFYHFNYTVSIQRESWRKRWYDKVGSVPEIFDDEDEDEQPAWWTLKKEVQAWLTSRSHPPESFKVPRPGSPNYIRVVCCTGFNRQLNDLKSPPVVDLPALCILFHIPAGVQVKGRHYVHVSVDKSQPQMLRTSLHICAVLEEDCQVS